MPVEWVIDQIKAPDQSGAFSYASGAAPFCEIRLWPNRSLPARGFVFFIAATAVMLALPLIAVLGSPVWWGLLPFILGTLALTWFLLRKSYRDGAMEERLKLWSDRIEVTRIEPNQPETSWSANPYWLRLALHPNAGPVENYITLRGEDREIELGAFLSPDERTDLYNALESRLIAVQARK
ncbi:DUF2244 domain-containing protein [Qingshengfaniella alkalisoli]|uniref:DUF2244 domain-containing protein n=1 Tax=Qingshengfaniella alkalisoli TaxID=2599296 RepID=A0A5B8J3P1_9RHOB|nr:DUF2244 domain-containing protein [Qingshengfaniella alkalisoli]QDY69107.1 DUF2244 domain-containing protein [Qingshengfaniella alkalisoli]